MPPIRSRPAASRRRSSAPAHTVLTDALSASPDLVATFAESGRLCYANPATLQLLGDLGHPGLDHHIGDLVGAGDVAYIQEWAVPYARRTGSWTGDLDFAAFGGDPRPFSVVLVAHDPGGGEGAWATIFARDLSERLRAERERRTGDLVAEAERVKSDLLAVMSHEIRTPLSAVIGLADLLGDGDLTGEQREHLTGIQRSAENALALLANALDMSKLRAGQVTLDVDLVDVRAMVTDACGRAAPAAAEHRAAISSHIAESVGSTLYGDGARLRQVLDNIIDNAVKFTENGSVTVGVEAIATPDPTRVGLQFQVSDTGVGIAPDRLRSLFAPFGQADGSMTREHGGAGLGLAVSRRLVDLMGGDIGIESIEGAGTTVWFTVALGVAPPEPAMTTTGALATVPAPGPDGTQPRGAAVAATTVLLVDDDPINRAVIGAMLRRLGVEVDVASGGREAIVAATQRDYAMVFMDCQMPGIDGVGATVGIRSAEGRHDTPIVAITANDTGFDRERCANAGMNDYFVKPLRRETLQAALDRWLPRSAGHRHGEAT
jgi:signal transduction histidine kinase/ActR/RegA family two-component response regulator